jgi:hypothetical protein
VSLAKAPALLAALVLLVSVGFTLDSRRDLQRARQELQSLSAANQFLRKTLGDMTVALSSKDKQIDRLRQGDCGGQAPPAAPPRRNAPPRQTHSGDENR